MKENRQLFTHKYDGNNNKQEVTITILLRRQRRQIARERERERGDDRAQRKRRQTKRERDSRANLLPAKICFYFHHLPLLPLLLPIKKHSQVEPSQSSKVNFLLAAPVGPTTQSSKVIFYSLPCNANNPINAQNFFRKNFFLPNICSKWFDFAAQILFFLQSI